MTQRWLFLTCANYQCPNGQEGVAAILSTPDVRSNRYFLGEGWLKNHPSICFLLWSHYVYLSSSFSRLDANKPMQYLENKAALNEALDRLNWPISLKELSILENEILAGKMYVQQAMELQEAVKKENYVSKALEEVRTMAGSVFAPSLLLRALDISVLAIHLLHTSTHWFLIVTANPLKVSGPLSIERKWCLILLWPYFLNNTCFNWKIKWSRSIMWLKAWTLIWARPASGLRSAT